MKTKHTDASHAVVDVATKMVVEDMSVSGLSDDEELLMENKLCEHCDFIASGEDVLKKHMDELHIKTPDLALNEEVLDTPTFVKPLALYKCNICPFANTTMEALQEHKKNEHEMETEAVNPVTHQPKPLPLYECDECTFMTRTEENLNEHKTNKHGKDKGKVVKI